MVKPYVFNYINNNITYLINVTDKNINNHIINNYTQLKLLIKLQNIWYFVGNYCNNKHGHDMGLSFVVEQILLKNKTTLDNIIINSNVFKYKMHNIYLLKICIIYILQIFLTNKLKIKFGLYYIILLLKKIETFYMLI
jgi:hypothetical protein